MKRILIEIHTGKDGRYSQRSVLGSLGFLGHMGISCYGAYTLPDTIAAILTINVGLIGFLLGMKTWQNNQEYKIDNAANS